MKKVIVIPVAVLLMVMMSCSKDETPTRKEEIAALLISAAAWDTPTVTVDDVDQSDVYKDFSITFNMNTYTTVFGSPIWVASGAWVFADENATKLLFDNAREAEINVSENELNLSFQWDEGTFGPGRTTSVKGKHKFKLKKKKKK